MSAATATTSSGPAAAAAVDAMGTLFIAEADGGGRTVSVMFFFSFFLSFFLTKFFRFFASKIRQKRESRVKR